MPRAGSHSRFDELCFEPDCQFIRLLLAKLDITMKTPISKQSLRRRQHAMLPAQGDAQYWLLCTLYYANICSYLEAFGEALVIITVSEADHAAQGITGRLHHI